MARPRRLRRSANLIQSGLLVGVALLLTFLLYQQLKSAPVEATSEPAVIIAEKDDTILLPTPTRNVARGEKLSEITFTKVAWPSSRLKQDYLIDISKWRNYTAATSLPKLLPVPVSSLSAMGAGMNAVVEGIPKGMRAITVRVDAESAVEGWARSGNYVDVILIRHSQVAGRGLEAKVIAENVKILSAGRSAQPLSGTETAPKAPNTVTLLAGQAESLRIRAAQSLGKLTFALRGTGDESPTLIKKVNQKQLLDSRPVSKGLLDSFQGYAKGPDGKDYVLTEQNERWIRSRLSANPLEISKSEKPAKDGVHKKE